MLFSLSVSIVSMVNTYGRSIHQQPIAERIILWLVQEMYLNRKHLSLRRKAREQRRVPRGLPVVTNKSVFDALHTKTSSLPTVQLTKEEMVKARCWAEKAAKAKLKEKQWERDGRKAVPRLTTGKVAERAVERLLDVKFSDDGIGPSKFYWRPDLKSLGLKCGIKAVNWGLVPLVPQKPRCDELIVILRQSKGYDKNVGDEAIIIGVASQDALKKYSCTDLVKDKNAVYKANGKTGFYGLEHCIRVETLEDLKKVAMHD